MIAGLPLDANGDYTGSFFALLNPFALLCGVLGLVTMLTQGASWLSLKAELGSELRATAAALRGKLSLVSVIVFLAVTVMFFAGVQPSASYEVGSMELGCVGAGIYLVAMCVMQFACKPENDKKDLIAHLLVSLSAAALVIVLGATLFPNLIPAVDPALSINIANAASSDTALTAMTIIACIGVPIMLVYHVIVYRTFRGRIG